MMIDLSLRLSKNLKNEALASVSSVDEMVRVVQALQTAKFTRNEGE
jgi:hypothetical protein